MSEEAPMPAWDRGTHIGILWGGFALATIFTVSRFAARWHVVRRFYIEDAFALAAWILIATYCALTHALLLDLYEIVYATDFVGVDLLDGDIYDIPARPNLTRSLEAKAASDMLGYSALWAVKFSFLFFFRRIYEVLDSWMKYWWIVLGITVTSFIGTDIASFVYYALIDYDCMSSIMEYRPRCTEDYFDHNMAVTNIDIARGAFDIFTDILIGLIPLMMLWKIRVSWRRKLVLGSVLLLTVTTIVLASLRLYFLISPEWVFSNGNLDMNWLNIEVYVALMLLSLGSIRSVFARRNSKPRYTPPSDSQQNAFRNSPRRWIATLLASSSSKEDDSHHSLFTQGATQWAHSVNDNMERIGQPDTERQ